MITLLLGLAGCLLLGMIASSPCGCASFSVLVCLILLSGFTTFHFASALPRLSTSTMLALLLLTAPVFVFLAVPLLFFPAFGPCFWTLCECVMQVAAETS